MLLATIVIIEAIFLGLPLMLKMIKNSDKQVSKYVQEIIFKFGTTFTLERAGKLMRTGLYLRHCGVTI